MHSRCQPLRTTADFDEMAFAVGPLHEDGGVTEARDRDYLMATISTEP
jgi:hypothetical protein